MIVKNEERYLRGCLESVKPFVDEIIIVDTGSTDTTVDIAKKFEAKVIPFQWMENFSEARNESLKHAAGNWILYLDADELLVEGFRLRALVKDKAHWAYTMLITEQQRQPLGIVEQKQSSLRLFRHHPQMLFEGSVCEQILPSIQKLNKSVGASSIVIKHLGYGGNVETVKEKCERNVALLETELADNPNDSNARYRKASMYMAMQEYVNAVPEIRAILSSDAGDSIKAAAANMLAVVTLHRNALSEAEFWCLQSLRFVRNQTTALWYLSGILAHDDKCEEALQLLHELKNETQSTPGCEKLPHDLALSVEQINERMLLCYDRLSFKAVKKNDVAEAEQWIEEAEEFGFRSYDLQQRGLETALARNDSAAARLRMEYLIGNLPAEAQPQLSRLLALKAQLEQAAVDEFPNRCTMGFALQ